jgi:hypothetical protein
MYVSIDMDLLKFLHKHPSVNVVANLVYIEAPQRTVNVIPIDGHTFWDMTPSEMTALYRNTTGTEPPRGDLKPMLLALANSLPTSDINAWEVEVQAVYCENNPLLANQSRFYVKGSTRPGFNADLYAGGLTGTLPEGQVPIAAPAPVQAAVPREGSVRDTIWKVADEVWEADGKPTDAPTVLQLRKRMMDLLERQGVKRTSSSNELGKWQKARI